MSPVRVDLTMRLARELGVAGERLRTVPAPMADDDLIATVHDPALIEAVMRAGKDPGGFDAGARARQRRQPGLPRHAPRRRPRRRRHRRGVPPGVERREPPQRQHHRRPAPRDARPGQRLLHLQRRRRRHPLAARPGRQRRSPTSTSTSTTATASRRSSTTTRGCSRSPCTRPARRSSPAPASRRTSAARTPRAARSTSPCRPVRRTPAGCAPSTRSCPPLLREFAPDVLVTQHGCDSHRDDPLADLMLSVDGQRASYLALHDLAHEVCDGRWVVTGGGGYALVEVVPRAWTHLLSVVGGHPLDASTPTPGRLARVRPGAPRPARAAPAHRRPRPRLPRLVARATTPAPGWTGRSTRPGRRSSRCTASTRSPERSFAGVKVKSGGFSTRHAGSLEFL